ncbi:glycosyltransferase family 4 protein [Nocardia cyriacigeorgica]|uniref:Glycosyltransferase family 4 protein n=1 Tax=Nocardia cyriacigeorgica TaxID=135487 RepID=A0A5R8PBF0_9NOCA|nr:glycosyltransferase [Nocardia cyriacigeorgica]TLG05321.1 glycosyltransferase family 4 protein [Nocardia cyriacigeorgica]
MTDPRIAIVHERFTEYGGSEAVVAEFMQTWPDAQVYAPIVTPDGALAVCRAARDHSGDAGDGGRHQRSPIHGSWLDRVYAATGGRTHAPLLPFAPRVLRTLPLRNGYDAVLVSHHSFATQAVFATDAPVIAYVHSPARWAWDRAFRAQESGGRAGQVALAALGRLARHAETRAAPRLTRVIANSRAVADRVRDWWGVPATVINPPVRLDRFSPADDVAREDFFLFAGRLVPYKRPDLAVRAAQHAGCRLVILGDGRARHHLATLAGAETTFLGAAPDDILLDMYRRCRALVMPGVEDFGIVPVEAMACGTPVLALGAGGALDTVVAGITGEHLDAGPDAAVIARLARAMRDFDPARYDPPAIRAHAMTFSPEIFRARISAAVTAAHVHLP